MGRIRIKKIKKKDKVEEAISTVRNQQEESLRCMALLKEQHEMWQGSVELLMAQIRSEQQEVDFSPPPRPQPQLPVQLSVRRSSMSPVGRSPPHPLQPSISQDAVLAIDNTVESFGMQEKGPLKRVVAEILSDAAKNVGSAEMTGWELYQQHIQNIVDSKWFEWAAGAIILLNMIIIGVEAEMSLRQDNSDTVFTDLERGFLVIYTVELLLRLIAGGWSMCCNSWWLMDCVLVGVGMIALVIAPTVSSITNTTFAGGMEKLLIIRGLRLLRLVRALRMISYFKVMWRLVYSLMTAGSTMLSTSALLLLALFIAGVIAVELITKDPYLNTNEITRPIVETYFSSLPTSILTLFQFVTLDSIAAVYFPLIQEKPELMFFFFPIGLVVSIGLMNLVTAVLVENALENAEQEKELERIQLKNKVKGALPAMMEIFKVLDQDHSGYISREEIEHVPIDILPSKLLENISIPSMVELFELLDVDGTGSLTQGEFVEGLLNMVLLDVPIWTVQSLRLLGSVKTMQSEIQAELKVLRHCSAAQAAPMVRERSKSKWLTPPSGSLPGGSPSGSPNGTPRRSARDDL